MIAIGNQGKTQMQTRRIDNGWIFQQRQAVDRSRQGGITKPELGQQYSLAGRLRVRGRQSGLAGGLRVRTGKGQNQEGEKKRDWEKQEQGNKNAC